MVVDTGIVDGSVVGGRVDGGMEVDAVGGGNGASVVVVAGASVVAVVVWTGGEVGAGAGDVATGARRAVVTTPAWVVTGPPATVVDDVDEVEVDVAFDVVVAAEVVEVGRAVVDGDWLATCCLGDVSSPVATSNNMAASAIMARAYSPTLKR